MTNKRTTKQALVASAILLCMSFTMLLGTTFAWFTDSATSAGNKIVAGTLDVDLYLVDASGETEITDESDPIFGSTAGLAQKNTEDTLWEPGKTQVVYLKIANNGSLDLKYQVAINVRDNADDKDLYKVLSYVITPGATYGNVTEWDGTDAKSVKVGNNVDTNNMFLDAHDAHYFALSVHMAEEAGNEYQGGYVEFDIKVAATQVASEEDSFGNQYDKDATYPVVSNVVNVPQSGTATEALTLSTVVSNDQGETEFVSDVTVPADTLDLIADEGVETLKVVHSEPEYDAATNSVTFEFFELMDQDGNVVDLEALNNDEPITVKVSVGDVFNVGETVVVYHDDEIVATAVVDADKNITYTTTHF